MWLFWRLGLRRQPQLNILDLGMGCGHFGVAAACFGHLVSGIDLLAGVSPISRFYSEYRALFSLDCRPFVIESRVPLPPPARKVDLVTGLLANFNGKDHQDRWGPDDWAWFIEDIEKNILKSGGRIFLQLTELLTGADTWAMLAKRSIWRNDKAMQVLLRPMS